MRILPQSLILIELINFNSQNLLKQHKSGLNQYLQEAGKDASKDPNAEEVIAGSSIPTKMAIYGIDASMGTNAVGSSVDLLIHKT